ncbi:Crp/Fnr family transcriptional regulator [Paraflavitalea pollutisoli]|uniref:Crp/Fnr family transcriptional regulator n=1 Tax=Paraflavitalea pollutisoli TaxID=3034143 RepID=UPI0023EC2961|nr:cyclic nucleotide-binding domain-containing protein [Paraflavitalea sp. H1-2-19X]
MEQLLAFLHLIKPMSSELEQDLRSIIKHRTVKKGEYILKAGNVCKEMCFITKGLLRCFIEKDGKEIVTWLLKEGDVATAVVSFHDETRSDEYIQALEDSEMYYILKDELEEIYEKHMEFNYHGRKLTIMYQLEGRKQYNIMLSLSAQERYELLEKTKPDLITRVPAKQLASYLRITEPYLSNIKSQRKLETKQSPKE